MKLWQSSIWHLVTILVTNAKMTRKQQSDVLMISVLWKGGRVV